LRTYLETDLLAVYIGQPHYFLLRAVFSLLPVRRGSYFTFTF
jgi:hypothetical protein